MCRHITLHFNCNHYKIVLSPSEKSCYIHDKRLIIETDFLTLHNIDFSLVLINSDCRWCVNQDTAIEEIIDGEALQADCEVTTLRTIPEESVPVDEMDISFTARVNDHTEVSFKGPRLVRNDGEDVNFSLTPADEGSRKEWWVRHDEMNIEETWTVSPPVGEEREEIEW